jgi:cytochrome c oxidase subunit II
MNSKRYLSVAFLLILSGILFPSCVPAALAIPRRIEITAKRSAFEPAQITIKKGEPIALVLTSIDVPHGIRFHELKIDIKANKGATAEARFTPDKTGDFVGHCSVFCGAGHGAMTLTIHVVE